MKAKIRKTGEIVEIISYSGSSVRSEILDSVSYIDSNGVEHDRESLNFYWDFEQLEEKTDNTDWNQVRIQAAIAATQGLLAGNENWYSDRQNDLAKISVMIADELVERLKE